MTLGIWSSLSGKSLIFLWFMLTQAEYFSFFLLLLAIKKSFYSLKVFRLDAKYKSFAFLEWTNEYCNEMHLCFSKNCIPWHNCQFWQDQRLTLIDFFGLGCFSIFLFVYFKIWHSQICKRCKQNYFRFWMIDLSPP